MTVHACAKDHPIFHDLKLHFHTKRIDEMSQILTRWTWTGQTGGYISGVARAGKTRMIQTLKTTLKDRHGQGIPSLMVTIPERDVRSIRSVYHALLTATGIAPKDYKNTDGLKNQFVKYHVDLIIRKDIDKFVIFVDEAQRLSLLQLNAFCELYDTFRNYHQISLTTIFVANSKQFHSVIKEISKLENDHIRGRFFCQSAKTGGLECEEQVRHVLAQYDTKRHPEPSGVCYTEFFIPDDFQRGFRLESLSEPLWAAFSMIQSAYGFDSWGMQYFTTTVNTLLTDFLPHWGVDSQIDQNIERCIELSGLKASAVIVE